MTILVTGTAGFVGNAVALKLLEQGKAVVGIDNLNDYYDVNLKKARLERLKPYKHFTNLQIDLADQSKVQQVFQDHAVDQVIHLAAQAGVRYSLDNPLAYAQSNLVGFLNILEGCRHHAIKHLVFASSSSVYGDNAKVPFSVHDPVDHPVSFYAATKRSNELMAHSYSHLFQIPTTGVRFFTVYGPWGRPDMAYFSFTKAILEGKPIQIFNQGQMERDFTYIDDIVEGVLKISDHRPNSSSIEESGSSMSAPFKIYNLGNAKPVNLLYFIECLEKEIGQSALKEYQDMQPGDVVKTWADVSDLIKDVGYAPSTPIEIGVKNFVMWYREFYKK